MDTVLGLVPSPVLAMLSHGTKTMHQQGAVLARVDREQFLEKELYHLGLPE